MFQELIGIDGRIGRLGLLVRAIVAWVLYIVGYALVLGSGPLLLVGVIFFLAAGVVSFCANIRRFHDLGTSGWAILLMAIPFVGIWFLLKLWFWPGNTLTNDYGYKPDGLHVGREGPGSPGDADYPR
jgi:uncharacterized membrane protein YhaH (DUF805 family)